MPPAAVARRSYFSCMRDIFSPPPFSPAIAAVFDFFDTASMPLRFQRAAMLTPPSKICFRLALIVHYFSLR